MSADAEGLKSDNELESKLILLLSQLEQHTAKIYLVKNQGKQSILTINLLAESVNMVIDLIEKIRFIKRQEISIIKALEDINAMYSEARLLYGRKKNRLSVKTAVKLFEGWVEDVRDRPFFFRKMCYAMCSLLEHYFLLMEQVFVSPSVENRWNSTYNVFLDDIRELVGKVKF